MPKLRKSHDGNKGQSEKVSSYLLIKIQNHRYKIFSYQKIQRKSNGSSYTLIICITFKVFVTPTYDLIYRRYAMRALKHFYFLSIEINK